MAIASGAQHQIYHVKEAVINTDPGTAYSTDRFLAGARLYNEAQSFQSAELRADRSVAPGILGAKHAKGTFPFELSFGTHEDWIESVMCNPWVAAGTPVTGQSVTVVAGTTNTMAATAIGTGLAVGDWIKVSGFTGAYVYNNGYFRVTTQATGTITLAEAVNADGTSRLAAASAQTGISVTKMSYIVAGIVEKSLSVEDAQADVNVFQRAIGFEVNQMSLAIQQGGVVTGSFDGIAFSLPAPAAVKYRTGSDVAATTSEPFVAYNALSFLYIDGVPSAVVTALSLQLANGMEDFIGAFQTVAYDILLGRSTLTGSMTLAFTSGAMLTKAFNNTHIALRVQMLNAAQTSGYVIDIPNIRLDMPTDDIQENKRLHTFSWTAEKDTTAGTLAAGVVNMKISKLA